MQTKKNENIVVTEAYVLHEVVSIHFALLYAIINYTHIINKPPIYLKPTIEIIAHGSKKTLIWCHQIVNKQE